MNKQKNNRLIYNYVKPPKYFGTLFIILAIISIFLGLALNKFELELTSTLFAKSFIILFLILFLAVLIEFFRIGEYMSLFEISKIEHFYNSFIKEYFSSNFDTSIYFNKYDIKTKNKFNKIFHKDFQYELTYIRKKKGIYELGFITKSKKFSVILKSLFNIGVHKMQIQKIENKYKIIHII